MIRKTYLIRFYNICQKLLAILILSGVLLLLANTLKLEYIINSLKIFVIGVSALLVILLLKEVITRIKKDSLVNLGKSLLGTFRFRLFLKQSQQHSKRTELSEQRQTENKVLTNFNRAVGKSVLDVSNQQLILFIKVPRQAQAQKILKAHEEQIKEHISSLYPEYLISTFERRKFNLWLIGTKRK
ncbi:MAG: hypothetical protein WBP78_03630 [Lactococcus raffinolactis]|jgi:hypothetical protein